MADESEANAADDESETKPSARKKRSKRKRSRVKRPIVVARTDHEAEESDELTFRAGDRIEVLRIGDPRGWWFGRVVGEKAKGTLSSCRVGAIFHRFVASGYYPSLYTQPLEGDAAMAAKLGAVPDEPPGAPPVDR